MNRAGFLAVIAVLLLGALMVKSARPGPRPASTLGKRDTAMKTEKATFGAGCFWGVEATFREVEGVIETSVGYMGGDLPNPTYGDVCTDRTGHAEVVEVEYDPAKVTYGQLLDVFWSNHDPTTLNRQGPDFGTQYRSVIFVRTPEQAAAAEASKAKQQELAARIGRRVVTEIAPAAQFWKAEEYHQQYLEKRGLGSCRY